MKSVYVAALLVLALVGGASAQSNTKTRKSDVIDSYTAYIGRDDLYNSSGARLAKPWQIIRQDRANFHAYNLRDRGDETDSFFADAVNRQGLEDMLSNGSMSRDAQLMILRGECWVNVQIFGQGSRGTWLEVEVWK